MKTKFAPIIVLIFLFFALVNYNGFSQSYYQKTYGDTCYDEGYSIYLCDDSSLVMAGYTCSYYDGTDDVYLIKTNQFGNLIWSKAIDIHWQERAYSVIQNYDSHQDPIYILTGDVRKPTGGSKNNAFLMTTDQNGVPTWIETFSQNANDDHGRCVIKTKDQSYLVAGYSNRCDSTPQDTCTNCNDVFLFKTDLAGTLLWAHYIDIAGGDDFAFKVIEANKRYYVTGYTRTTTCPNTNVFLMQVQPSGIVDWVKTYGDSLGDFSFSIKSGPDTSLIMVGHTYNYAVSQLPDILVIKTDYNGVPKWKYTYNTKPYNHLSYGRDIVVASDGYYVAGYSDAFNSTSFDMHLLKINTAGNMNWQRAYGGTEDDKAFALVKLNTGVAMVGYTYSNLPSNHRDDVFLVKTNLLGVSCDSLLDTNNVRLDSIYTSVQFEVDTEYVYQSVGNHYESPDDEDTICYDTSHVSPRYGGYRASEVIVFPNPVSGKGILTIQINNSVALPQKIVLLDQIGKTIMSQKISRNNEGQFNIYLKGISPGIYVLKIDEHLVKEIIILE